MQQVHSWLSRLQGASLCEQFAANLAEAPTWVAHLDINDHFLDAIIDFWSSSLLVVIVPAFLRKFSMPSYDRFRSDDPDIGYCVLADAKDGNRFIVLSGDLAVNHTGLVANLPLPKPRRFFPSP